MANEKKAISHALRKKKSQHLEKKNDCKIWSKYIIHVYEILKKMYYT